MSYASAEGLPVTYSQVNVTNAASTETLIINTNSVQVAAGSDLYLGSLGDATQLTLAPGLVTSNTPFEVSSGAQGVSINSNSVEAVGTGNVLNLGSPGDATQLVLSPGLVNCNTPFEVTNNSTIVSLGTQNNGVSVLSSTSTILELNVAPSAGVAPVPVIAVDAALITAYAPIYPSTFNYPINAVSDQYPIGYVYNLPLNTFGSPIVSTGAFQSIQNIAIPSAGVWSVIAQSKINAVNPGEVIINLYVATASSVAGQFVTSTTDYGNNPTSSQLLCPAILTATAATTWYVTYLAGANLAQAINVTYTICRIA